MKLKELLTVDIMNLILYNLDEEQFLDYDEIYDDYEVVQIFSDELDDELKVCVDITENDSE